MADSAASNVPLPAPPETQAAQQRGVPAEPLHAHRPGSVLLLGNAGIAYRLITPCVLGVMLMFVGTVHRPTLSVAGWLGTLFGLLNMVIRFVVDPASWWMGVCHVPLLLFSVWALWDGRHRRS